ncbi:hypothetical protein ACFYO2_45455 [Streptomyces sp. NPDC006602]|uniref:hypothetical protein n=1 Tax=Streptomyces sp. NPDC006602 TaxID=3364751 RepID=UPI0036B38DB1
MLLRLGTTCVETITLLDRLTGQGLNDVQNSVPHVVGTTVTGMPQEHWDAFARMLRMYDE